MRGWNWGKAEFGRAELAFNVQNRPAFEIPYSEITNTNLAGKNEIAVEFNLGSEPSANGINGHRAGSTKNRGRKAAAARDELVEMRFYIPGTVSKKEVNGEDAGSGEDEEDAEEQNAANLFYETLMDKAEIGDVAGATFATFQDILHLTPRFVLTGLSPRVTEANAMIEDALTSTCMKRPFAFAARPMTTRSSISRSRSSLSFPRTMKCTLLSHWDLILHYDKARQGIHSSSCSSSSMTRSTWTST